MGVKALLKNGVLVAVGVLMALSVGASSAYFTGQADVPENMIRAGSVAVSAEPTSAALAIDALAPGATITRLMTVVNDGNLPVDVTVTGAKKLGITDFYNALTARVTADGAVLYEGPMNVLRTSPLGLAPGARTQLQFAVGLPAEAGNDLMGDYVKMTLYVDAEQAH